MRPAKRETYAPIALFVHNRPLHTRRTVTALQRNRGADRSSLFVFSDAPRKRNEVKNVRIVRDYVKTVEGFRTITIIEQEQNLGLAGSIIEGVTRLCKDYGRVIAIEDDLVTSPYFLSYMNEGLNRYENEKRVMQIAGYMFPVNLTIDEDALFLPFISSWGWATWERAWRHFDPHAVGYRRLQESPELRRQFDLDGHYQYYDMLEAQRKGRIDSWAIRWYLSVFMQNALALYPRKTLVHNIGADGTGVNCVSGFRQESIDNSFNVVRFPHQIDVSPHAHDVFRFMPRPVIRFSSIWNRMKRYAGRQFA